jgi:alkylation response protein AidB-like acyl-CoA dehydrogenase
MYIGLTEEQGRLQQEVRDYYKQLLTPEVRAKLVGSGGIGNEQRKVVRQMGEDGWLGVGWPEEWGGRGFSAVEQFIWFDESMRSGAPVPMLTINTVGPTIRHFGSDEQKDFFLPKIMKGEIHFCIGYSEPGAGTDLAALQTKAVRDGDEYIINGQKVFTTGGHDADVVWLACRTDPDAPKHKGISIILVPTAVAGFKHTPIWTLGGGHTNATYYEDVRVPAANVVGEENAGWKLITRQLNHERVALGPAGRIERPLRDVLRWAQETRYADGRRVIDDEWVQISLARVHATAEALKLANWRVAAALDEGSLNPADASAMKVLGTEQQWRCLRLLLDIVGSGGYVTDGSPGAVLRGQLEQAYRHAPVGTFGGGVNEVQREIIAMAGLDMPRAPR